jgi:hypothetical protein
MINTMERDESITPPERKRPSRMWYLASAVVLLASLAVFLLTLRAKVIYLQAYLEPMPRFVGPTDEDGVVITLDDPGKHNIYYENRGEFEDRIFDTPRRQVWTTYESPAMRCSVINIKTGEPLAVRLPGQDEPDKKSKTSEDQVVAYDISGMQGYSIWVFDADEPGDYRIKLDYDPAVYLEHGDVQIPPELTKAQKREMLSEDGDNYEAARRAAIEQASLAQLEPIDVLFAVGPQPTVDSFFNVIGLKGAATLLAFGFTFAALTSLVTLMLRGGHVTPRGDIESVKRMGQPKA